MIYVSKINVVIAALYFDEASADEYGSVFYSDDTAAVAELPPVEHVLLKYGWTGFDYYLPRYTEDIRQILIANRALRPDVMAIIRMVVILTEQPNMNMYEVERAWGTHIRDNKTAERLLDAIWAEDDDDEPTMPPFRLRPLRGSSRRRK